MNPQQLEQVSYDDNGFFPAITFYKWHNFIGTFMSSCDLKVIVLDSGVINDK